MRSKLFKKISCMLLAFLLLFSSMGNVYAKTLTVNEVVEAFSKTEVKATFEFLGIDMSAQVNSTAGTIDFYATGEKVGEVKYTNEYIEYTNKATEVTEQTVNDSLFDWIGVMGLLEAVINLSGYDNMTVEERVNDYEKYGLIVEGEDYKFSSNDETGSYSISGFFIKHIKISLDTAKIEALIQEYGVEEEEYSIAKYLKPEVEAKDITKDSVTLYTTIPGLGDYYGDTLYCNIYRSNSIEGKYDLITETPVDCLVPTAFVDKDLLADTTYYYKALVVGGELYSEPIEVRTKVSYINDTVNNPKTGVSSYVLLGSLIAAVSITIYTVAGKKNLFRKI